MLSPNRSSFLRAVPVLLSSTAVILFVVIALSLISRAGTAVAADYFSAGDPTKPIKSIRAAPALQMVAFTATKRDALLVDSDSDGDADPGDALRYTVVITNTGSDPATDVTFIDTIDMNTTLSGTAHVSPIAFDDSYESLGNVGITVTVGSGLLANDVDPDNNSGTLTVASADSSSDNGGEVSVAADGSFTYTPAPGFEGTDSFTYTVSDGDPLTPDGPGTVTITVAEMIWFVDNAAAGGGDGRLATPYNSLSAFSSGAADEAGDIIFLYSGSGSYTDGITLLDNQFLIGQGATASIAAITGITVPPHSNALPGTGGASPTITNGSGDSVTLAAGNTLRGFDVGAADGFGVAGSSVGALAISEVSVNNSSGGGVNINGSGTMDVVFDALSSSGGTNGISLANVAGTFTANGGSVNGSSGTAVSINGGNAAITYAGSVSKTSAGSLVAVTAVTGGSVTLAGNLTCTTSCTGVSVSSNNGGTITFSGVSKVLNTGGNTAVNLTNNTGTTINFSNGGLDIDTTSGIGFNATGGGAVNVTGSGNHVNTTTGTCVNIANTTIGSSDVTFESISVNGATNGIVLNNTGSGAFTVSGDGSMTGGVLNRNGSGGTIQNTTDDGVSLTSASNVTLRQMNILNVGNSANSGDTNAASNDHAIESRGGGSIVLSAVHIQNPIGTGWEAFDITGVNRIDHDSLIEELDQTSNFPGLRVRNTDTDFTSFTITNTQFDHKDPTPGDAATNGNAMVVLSMRGTSSGSWTVTDSTFTGARGQAMTLGIGDTIGSNGTVITNIANNTFEVSHSINGQNNLGITTQESTMHGVTITGNVFRDVGRGGSNSGQIIVQKDDAATLDVSISNNIIHNVTDQRGIEVLSLSTSSGGQVDAEIFDNNVYNIGREGVFISARGSEPDMDVRVFNNCLGRIETGTGCDGAIQALGGQNDGSGILVDAQNASSLDIKVDGNQVIAEPASFGGCGGSNCGVLTINVENFPSGSAVVNATVEDNALNNNNAGGTNFLARARDCGLTLNLDLGGNGGGGSGGGDGIANTATGSTTTYHILDDSFGCTPVPTVAVENLANVHNDNLPTGNVITTGVVNFPGNVPEPDFTLLVNRNIEKDNDIALRQNEDTAVEYVTPVHPVHFVVGKLANSADAVTVPAIEQVTIPLSGENINIPVGTLPAGKSVTVIFDATIDNTIAANDAEVCNQATIQSNELLDVLTDDPDTGAVGDATCTAVPQADLSLSKTDSPDPVLAGDALVYTVTVSNDGPSAAQNVVVTDTLPAGLTFVATSGCTEDPNGLPTCTLGTIPASDSAQFTIQTTVDAGTSGTITNSASVVSSTHDPVSGNNTAEAETAVHPPASITIVKDADPADGTDFAFTSDLGSFTLDDADPDDTDGISDTETFSSLFPGTYTFTETAPLPGDFALTGLTCDTGSWSADLGSQAVTVTLAAGEDVTCTFSNAINQPPALANVAITSPIDENSTATLTGDISDPDTGDSFTLTVDWGDGSAPESFNYAAGTTSFSETHPYLDDNPTGTPSDSNTAGLTLEDSAGNSTTGNTSTTVNNVPPTLTGVAASSAANGTVTLTGNIVDLGTQDTLTLTVDWGDGSLPETFNYAAGTTSFSETYPYPDNDSPNTYAIDLTLEDDDTGVTSDQVTVTVGESTIFLPVVFNNYARLPDLIVDDLVVTSSDVQVLVRNVGDTAVVEDFWVDVYIDPSPPPTGVNQTWQMLADEGLVWGVSGVVLQPGDTLLLTIGGSHYFANQSNFSGAILSGTPVYAQVDSANAGVNTGAVLETHELAGGAYNNIAGPVTPTTTLPFLLPAIGPPAPPPLPGMLPERP